MRQVWHRRQGEKRMAAQDDIGSRGEYLVSALIMFISREKGKQSSRQFGVIPAGAPLFPLLQGGKLLLGIGELLLQLLDLALKLVNLLVGVFGALPPGVAAEADIVDADLESLELAAPELGLAFQAARLR
jgi:hypothetical protein